VPKLSPFARTFPKMKDVAGVKLASTNCGIRYKTKPDLMIAVMPEGTCVAGAYTKSLAASAPVMWCKRAAAGGSGRILVVNSGNSNAFTGKLGEESVQRVVDFCAKKFNVKRSEVFMASTGVIGEPLPDHLITNAIPALADNLSVKDWEEAAKAIMTTDTFPKGISKQAMINGVKVNISGFAKGSGMIAPNMGTMLGFIFTDAVIPPKVLREITRDVTERTFNSITVDGDTSTSDTVLVFATGQQTNKPPKTANDDALKDFKQKFYDVMLDLAHQIVLDGEGISRFIEITVSGAASVKAAKNMAMTIANSPLVKTAVAGADPNWGRVIAACGRSGDKFVQSKAFVKFGTMIVAKDGQVAKDYDEASLKKYMQGDTISIQVGAGAGKSSFTVWTCDLTHDYITINASYKT